MYPPPLQAAVGGGGPLTAFLFLVARFWRNLSPGGILLVERAMGVFVMGGESGDVWVRL